MDPDQLAAWLMSRAGKLTASRMGDAMAVLRNGKPSESRAKYMRELLAERVTGQSVRHLVTPAMEWGLLVEPEAKAAYEMATGRTIRDSAFYDHPRIDMFGATPDGELPGRIGAECKCPNTATFLEWALTGEVPDQHKPQMIAQCVCAGFTAVEFIAYDPRVRDPKRRLFIRRYTPTAEEIAKVEAAAEQFLTELAEMERRFTADFGPLTFPEAA